LIAIGGIKKVFRVEFDDGLDGRGQLEFRDEDDLADVLARE